MREIIDTVLNAGAHYPDLLSVLVGSLAGYVLTLVLERYFLPQAIEPNAMRRQQGFTFFFCAFVSGTLAQVFWYAIDPSDSFKVRAIVSYISAIVLTFAYPIIANYATSRIPAIASAWRDKE